MRGAGKGFDLAKQRKSIMHNNQIIDLDNPFLRPIDTFKSVQSKNLATGRLDTSNNNSSSNGSNITNHKKTMDTFNFKPRIMLKKNSTHRNGIINAGRGIGADSNLDQNGSN